MNADMNLTPAMMRAVDLIKQHGRIEADWRNGFNSCGKWIDGEARFTGPRIRMITLDALVGRGVLIVEEAYSYHGYGEWIDHQVYVFPGQSNWAHEGYSSQPKTARPRSTE